MSGSFFKFIFYLIIIIFWTFNNAKKLSKGVNQPKPLPKKPAGPRENPSLQPKIEPIFNALAPYEIIPDAAMKSPDQILQMRLERIKARKEKHLKKNAAPAASSLMDETEIADETIPEPSPPVLNEIKKPSLCLKSSIKDGIIWSIILGPPRSKEPFNWRRSSFQR